MNLLVDLFSISEEVALLIAPEIGLNPLLDTESEILPMAALAVELPIALYSIPFKNSPIIFCERKSFEEPTF